MARRRNLKDLLTPEPTPDRQLTHPSGWCMTNEHAGCKYQFDHGKCGCGCHIAPKSVKIARTKVSDDSKTQKTQKKPKAVAPIADTTDPRPWKR